MSLCKKGSIEGKDRPFLCGLQGSSKEKELPHSHTIYIPQVFGIACDELNPDDAALTELTYSSF